MFSSAYTLISNTVFAQLLKTKRRHQTAQANTSVYMQIREDNTSSGSERVPMLRKPVETEVTHVRKTKTLWGWESPAAHAVKTIFAMVQAIVTCTYAFVSMYIQTKIAADNIVIKKMVTLLRTLLVMRISFSESKHVGLL